MTISPPEKQVEFSMAIGNVEVIFDCFPEHSRMGTARIKSDKETEGRYEERHG